jgi:hypothetical protein
MHIWRHLLSWKRFLQLKDFTSYCIHSWRWVRPNLYWREGAVATFCRSFPFSTPHCKTVIPRIGAAPSTERLRAHFNVRLYVCYKHHKISATIKRIQWHQKHFTSTVHKTTNCHSLRPTQLPHLPARSPRSHVLLPTIHQPFIDQLVQITAKVRPSNSSLYTFQVGNLAEVGARKAITTHSNS